MNESFRKLGPILLGLGLYFQGIPPSWDFIYNVIKYRISEEKNKKLVKDLADFLKEKGVDSSWALEIIEFFVFRIPSFCLDIAKDTVEDLINKGTKPKTVVDFLNKVMTEYRMWIRHIEVYGRGFPSTSEIRILFSKLMDKIYKEMFEE